MKKFLSTGLAAALTLTLSFLKAQDFTRVYRADVSNKEFAFYDLDAVPGGGWYASGQGVGNFQLSIARFDANGSVLWAKISEERRGVSSIVALQNGGVMIFGNNQDFQSYFDASALHLNADGDVVNETVWGQPNDIDGWSAAKRFANGEVLAIGVTLTEELFVDQLLMAKFSATGGFLWEKSFEGAFADIIEIPDNGGFYLTGANLARFDADGEPVWGKSYDFAGEDVGIFKGIRCPDGSLLFAGWDRRVNFTNEHLLLFKTDADGEPIWVKSFDGPQNIGMFEIDLLDAETAVVTATSSTQSLPIVDNDNVVLRFSLDGELLSTLAFGSSTKDFPFDSFLDGDEVVICGLTSDAGGTDSTRAYISRSSLTASDCTKDYPMEEVAAPDLPTTGDLSLLPFDVTAKTDFPATLATLQLSEQVTCGTVSALEPGACDWAAPSSLWAALEAVAPVSQEVYLRVFDLSGKLVFEKNNPTPNEVFFEKTPLPSGIYFYALQFEACGKKREWLGKLPVLNGF